MHPAYICIPCALGMHWIMKIPSLTNRIYIHNIALSPEYKNCISRDKPWRAKVCNCRSGKTRKVYTIIIWYIFLAHAFSGFYKGNRRDLHRFEIFKQSWFVGFRVFQGLCNCSSKELFIVKDFDVVKHIILILTLRKLVFLISHTWDAKDTRQKPSNANICKFYT